VKNFELTKDAEKDLREVARYTLNKWGREMLQEYRAGLKKLFEEIGKSNITKRQFSDNFPE
jgi:toxin ParE1/3/4